MIDSALAVGVHTCGRSGQDLQDKSNNINSLLDGAPHPVVNTPTTMTIFRINVRMVHVRNVEDDLQYTLSVAKNARNSFNGR